MVLPKYLSFYIDVNDSIIKLVLNVFFVRALNSHLKSQDIIVNTVNPGLCYSELLRDARGLDWLYFAVFQKLLARQTEEGSRQLVWAAVGAPNGGEDSLDKLRGAYINLAEINEPADFVLGEEGKKREDKLWVSHRKTNLGPSADVCGPLD